MATIIPLFMATIIPLLFFRNALISVTRILARGMSVHAVFSAGHWMHIINSFGNISPPFRWCASLEGLYFFGHGLLLADHAPIFVPKLLDTPPLCTRLTRIRRSHPHVHTSLGFPSKSSWLLTRKRGSRTRSTRTRSCTCRCALSCLCIQTRSCTRLPTNCNRPCAPWTLIISSQLSTRSCTCRCACFFIACFYSMALFNAMFLTWIFLINVFFSFWLSVLRPHIFPIFWFKIPIILGQQIIQYFTIINTLIPILWFIAIFIAIFLGCLMLIGPFFQQVLHILVFILIGIDMIGVSLEIHG